MVKLNDAYELANYIKDAKKLTPVKVYISGNLKIEKNDKTVSVSLNFFANTVRCGY